MSSRFSIIFSAWLARLVCRHPIIVLVIGGLVAAASVWVSVDRLQFQPNRNDLLSKDLAWNQRIIDWWRSFPHMSDMVVAVDTHAGVGDAQARRAEAESFVRDLAERLRKSREIVNVDWGAPEKAFSPKTARLLPLDEFKETIERVEDSAPIVHAPTLSDALADMSTQISQSRSQSAGAEGGIVAGIRGLRGFVDAIGASLEGTQTGNPFEASDVAEGASDQSTWRFLETPNGRFLIVRLTPRNEADVLNEKAEAIDTIRAAIDDLKTKYEGVDVGLTGISVVESDETKVATMDSAISSFLAFGVIAALMIASFHGWRKPLQAMLALVVGIAWTFGFLTLAIGHLQILSVVFVVILLGLGIDFAIHISTTIEEFRHQHPDGRAPFQKVLAETFQLTGPGVLTGAATTAAAFASTTFTDFRGVAELGIIACAGIVLCMISMFTLYPAMLSLFQHSYRHIRPLAERSFHIFNVRWILPMVRHPLITVGIATLITAAAGIAGWRVKFSEDLLALQPTGVASVQWQQRLSEQGDLSIWYGVSVCDSLNQARARRNAFEKLATVEHVGGIGILFPEHEPEKDALIRKAREQLGLDGPIPSSGSTDGAALRSELTGMRSLLTVATRGVKLAPALDAALKNLGSSIDAAVASLDSLTGDARDAALARLTRNYAAFREGVIRHVGAVLETSPLAPDDLPPAVLDTYVSKTGPTGTRYALEVYPKLPEAQGVTSPLDPRFLDIFMHAVQSVDPHITGVLPQIYYSNEVIRASFVRSGAIAIVVVLVIVLVVFRSLVAAAMCMMPVVIGFVLTFGVMDVFGLTVNPANIIVLPLLFGIGVDCGVHVMHRWRLNPHERPLGLTHGTGKGVTLTSLTTMAGFASMLVARHRGIQALGLVMTIGIGLTLATCWTVLPAVLELRARSRGEGAASGHSEREAAHANGPPDASAPREPGGESASDPAESDLEHVASAGRVDGE